MSHTTTLKTVAIRDVAAMRQAVEKLRRKGVNCELVENAVPRLYYQNQVEKCDYVLKLHDSRFDVGFKRQEDGTYAPVFDEWGNHVGTQVGASCPLPRSQDERAQHQIGQFLQAYSEAATVNAAVSQGYSVESTHVDDEGNVHLTLGGM